MKTRKRSHESSASPASPLLHDVTSAIQNIQDSDPLFSNFPTPESYSSLASSPAAFIDTKDLTLDSDEPRKKKVRTRKNAKTEEEKAARAEERALRNRRAAQESRDRKKHQFDLLQCDNERLRQENKLLKEKLDMLEQKFNGIIKGKTEEVSSDVVETVNDQKEIKTEVGAENEEESKEDITQTHYPAAVMSYDQQCQVILLSISLSSPPILSSPTLSSTSQLSSPTTTLKTSTSFSHLPHHSISNSMNNKSQPTLQMYSTNTCYSLPSPLTKELLKDLNWASQRIPGFEVCATFDGLNDFGCSLDRGAKFFCWGSSRARFDLVAISFVGEKGEFVCDVNSEVSFGLRNGGINTGKMVGLEVYSNGMEWSTHALSFSI